ncbi:uncharacterized protein LOC124644582 [Helicoverpa zea]|uniref:uncharacterized protein LOC124644582 n=1 Tax=Helicoverpa zea TaxID=7113 RepID=UPI001F5650B5|nr:uncharacterized protein LOC124644582 [Helicoverpa zea]
MTSQQQQENFAAASHTSHVDSSEILLATALVSVKGSDGSEYTLRALVDQGSQISLITESAAQLINIKRQRCKGVIFGVGQKENNCKGVISIVCASLHNNFIFETEAFIMTNLIKSLPNKSFPKPDWSHIDNIPLADPEFYISRPVDLLLGADVYANIMLSGIIKSGNAHQPLVQQTQLGWLLCGNVKTYQCNVVLNNIEEIRRFWQVEEISETSNLSTEDQECLTFYESTTRRTEEGRYEVRIPLKEELKHKLGMSKPMAIAQLRNLETKFRKHEHLASKYKTFMKEYLELQHMKPEETNSQASLQCYLPHHCVQRDDSLTTKLRVVFNASAKTSTRFSLNDIMCKGPNMQKDLQSLLLQWRQYPYAFTADIEKMFRQVLVNNNDQHLQKIVWRESPEQPIQSFQLTTITYGTKSAPFLAMRTLKQLASDERSKHPEAAEILENSFLMDDLLHGAYNIKQGKYLIKELHQLLKLGGFTLRKWASNNDRILESVKQNAEETSYHFKNEETSKTLGLCWQTKQDHFTFNFNFTTQIEKLTKRQLLSEISKLFDPLGWLTPLSTKLKLLFQKLWQTDLQWDDEVSGDVYKEWCKLTADIENIKHCVVPRWIKTQENSIIEFHGFCDASVEAYACVVYARTKHSQEAILVAGKSKLIPHRKAITLPRTELCGALLLAKLMSKITSSISCPYETYGWCDSMVVLGWIHGDSTRWTPFVSNRINAIKQIMPSDNWRYVKSAENAADCASRGLTASQLLEHPLWWHGPAWLLSLDMKKEQNQQPMYTTEEEKRKIKQVNVIQQTVNIIEDLLNNYSSFRKIIHIFAWILRALTPISQRKHLPSYLTLRELRKAKLTIIKYVQRKEFAEEVEKISKNGTVGTKSKLFLLNCFIDDNGILRVGGRLRHANLSSEMKYPKVIPNKSRLAELLIEECHLLTFHGGPKLTLATMRKQYWIPGGIKTTKAQLRNCVTCRKHAARKEHQLMGDLPAARANPAPPFYHTGVDYTGFVEVKANKGRGVRTTKGYVAVFICMVTKAVHLELVSDLTSSAFLAALSRMAARRGAPRHMYSDQGTNFIGANRSLREEYEEIQQVFGDKLLADIADMEIEWHFNAPSWPSAGGLWERAVRSLKYHLKRVVGEQRLTFEEYTTILTKIEACLNSRPLCSLNENIEDLEYISPAHFLTGRSGNTVIETKQDARTRWHLTTNITRQIWLKWKTEYLTQLTAREKWGKPQRNMKIGDMVVVHEDNVPAGKWIMGKVVDVHPGSDGYVRVVTLKTKGGVIKRPVVKLSLLPIETDEQQDKFPETNTQTSNIEGNQSPRGTRRKSHTVRFSYIVMALTFFMTMCGSAHGAYNVTQFGREQSLFFDSIGRLSLAKDKWTMVIFYDMSPYWEGISAFNKIITYLDTTCKTIGGEHCNTITTQLSHEANELKYYNQFLLDQQEQEWWRLAPCGAAAGSDDGRLVPIYRRTSSFSLQQATVVK